MKNGSCFFTITQDICVAVPVEFGAVATVGDSYINCNGASEKDICTDCEVMPPIPPRRKSPRSDRPSAAGAGIRPFGQPCYSLPPCAGGCCYIRAKKDTGSGIRCLCEEREMAG